MGWPFAGAWSKLRHVGQGVHVGTPRGVQDKAWVRRGAVLWKVVPVRPSTRTSEEPFLALQPGAFEKLKSVMLVGVGNLGTLADRGCPSWTGRSNEASPRC